MKTILSVLIPACLIILLGCQKEVSSEPGYSGGGTGGGVRGTLKMKVNGKEWVADKVAIGSIMAGITNISGQSKDGKTFTITLADTKARKYTLTNVITSLDSANAAAFSDSSSFSNYSWGTEQGDDTTLAGGWVIVSKIDQDKKKMSGTFQMKMFRLLDSSVINITDGVFDNLSFETSLPPAAPGDTLKVKIEGTAWAPSSIVAASTGGQLVIVANENPLNRTVGLTMPSNITTGTYTLDFLGGQYIGLYNPNTTTADASTSGTLTILEHNLSTKRIRGTFNFTAEPPLGGTAVHLTEGYFSVKYQ